MSDQQWTVEPEEAGVRLDKFLAAADRLASRARAAAAIERGQVYLNGSEAEMSQSGTRLAAGDTVRVWLDRPGSARSRSRSDRISDLQVLYEDNVLMVVNKPAGLLAVPLERKHLETSAYEQLEDHFRTRGRKRPFVVHRIDRDTSGLVVFAKNPSARDALKEQFKQREPERVYWAVVYGHPDPSSGTWRDHLVWDRKSLIQKETHPRDPLAKEAVCDYEVLESFRDASLLEVRLRTGRRNQIRIQARLRGHTLVGERRYVYGPDSLRTIAFDRQALHARRLAFRHPLDDRTLVFEAPVPLDFQSLLDRLRRQSAHSGV